MSRGQDPVAPAPRGMDAGLPPLVLFDHDGVLADSFAVFSEAFLAACREEGLTAVRTPDDVRALFGDNVYVSLERAGASRRQVPRHPRRARLR